MIRVLKILVSFFSVGLLLLVSLGLRAMPPLPQIGQAMDGMHHSMIPSVSCNTLCTTATFNRDEYLSETENNDDDEPNTPLYAPLQTAQLVALNKLHSQQARFAMEQEPPPKGLPAYIALTVFRA